MTYSSSTSDENGNYAFNAMANHSCDTGFVLVGNNTRTCTGDGSSTTGVFDGEAVVCERELMQNVTVNPYNYSLFMFKQKVTHLLLLVH